MKKKKGNKKIENFMATHTSVPHKPHCENNPATEHESK